MNCGYVAERGTERCPRAFCSPRAVRKMGARTLPGAGVFRKGGLYGAATRSVACGPPDRCRRRASRREGGARVRRIEMLDIRARRLSDVSAPFVRPPCRPYE